MDPIYLAPASCPHCGCDKAELLPPIGDRNDCRCSECGTFRVSRALMTLFQNGGADPRRCRFVYDAEGQRWLREEIELVAGREKFWATQ